MTKADLTRHARELPIEEQLDLAQELWEQASPPAEFTLPDDLKELLEARLREARENPGSGVPWEEVRARLRRRA
jgi:putative addiction module component (TIGR02574 family)